MVSNSRNSDLINEFESCLQDLNKAITLLHEAISSGLKNVDEKSEIEKFKYSSILNFYSQLSAIYIYGKNQKACPVAPLAVLTRAAYESLLLFHYMLIDPASNEDLEMRLHYFNLRMYCSTLQVHEEIQFRDKNNIVQLKDETQNKLENNSCWKNFSSDFKENLLARLKSNNHDAKIHSWSKIRKNMNLSERFDLFYYFVCDYAHSGPLSINNNLARINIDERIIVAMDLVKHVNYLCGLAILNYNKLNNFPKAKSQNTITQANNIISKYQHVIEAND